MFYYCALSFGKNTRNDAVNQHSSATHSGETSPSPQICINVFIIWGAFNGFEQIINFFFQNVQELSVLDAALRFIPTPVGHHKSPQRPRYGLGTTPHPHRRHHKHHDSSLMYLPAYNGPRQSLLGLLALRIHRHLP